MRNSTETHQNALERLQSEKELVQEEVGEAQRGIERLQEELQQLHEFLEEANKNLDGVKRTAGKVQKAHDKTFKEIAGKVRPSLAYAEVGLMHLQNDQIEALSMERMSLYRKCRLEEINLPLKSGNLRNVPMEEVPRETHPLTLS